MLYFFRRLVVDCDQLMRENPKLLVKCLFGLIQVHSEYSFYFSLTDITTLLARGRHKLTSFDEQLVCQWLSVYLSEWKDDYDKETSLNELVQTSFSFELFECKDTVEFMDKYVHLVFEYCLKEFDRLPKQLASSERYINYDKLKSIFNLIFMNFTEKIMGYFIVRTL